MNKKQLVSHLEKMDKDLDSLDDKISGLKVLKNDFSLQTRTSDGKTRYFKFRDGNRTEQEYLGKECTEEIKDLATKSYALKLQKAAELEKKQIDKCIEILKSEGKTDYADIDLVYDRLADPIKKLIKPSVVTDDGFAEKWQNEKYKNRWKGNADYTIETPRDEKVRSKSEWIIACMLAEAGVPYRYEECVGLNKLLGMVFYPDFTVLNKRTREVFFWEHFGKMDDPKYINESYMPKMLEYYNFGFLPGKKLLMTFESKRYPLDTTQVKRLIEEFLL